MGHIINCLPKRNHIQGCYKNLDQCDCGNKPFQQGMNSKSSNKCDSLSFYVFKSMILLEVPKEQGNLPITRLISTSLTNISPWFSIKPLQAYDYDKPNRLLFERSFLTAGSYSIKDN